MTQYSSVNVKISYSQINRPKSTIKNVAEVNLKLSSNMIGDLSDETNYPHRLLLTDRKASKLCKTFMNNLSVFIQNYRKPRYLNYYNQVDFLVDLSDH